ncbi:12515_t:CDS:1, partial [Funneliformis geosporum]
NNATTTALMTKKLNSTYPELNVSTRTVQRILKNKLHYVICRLRAVPLLKPNHIEAHFQ